MTRLRLLLSFCLLAGVLCACGSSASEAIDLQPGENAACGQINRIPPEWKNRSLFVYAAEYTGSAESGYYVLEPDIHPHTQATSRGVFCIYNLPGQTYILLAGPSPEESLRLTNGNGEPILVAVTPNELLELGKVHLMQ